MIERISPGASVLVYALSQQIQRYFHAWLFYHAEQQKASCDASFQYPQTDRRLCDLHQSYHHRQYRMDE